MVEPQWHSRIHTNLVQNQDQWHNDSTSLMVCLAFFMTTRHKNLLKNAEKGAKLANGQFSLAQLLKKKTDFKPFIETFIYTAEWCPCIALGTM